MPVNEPSWWHAATLERPARLLAPFGFLYGAMTERRFRKNKPYRSRLPVICIGNLTAGGTGKTPLALLVAEYLASKGETPVFLTRGHGGRAAGPRWVDPARDTARITGDEALLLARAAPVLIARDRKAGTLAIEREGTRASVIVMDDGLQNPALEKDLAVAVVDGARGLGNGRIIPAGPLRARLEFQLGLVDAVVVNGPAGASAEGRETEVQADFRRRFGGPVLAAEPMPAGDTSWLAGASVAAYAGIGNPRRFFDMLRAEGANLAVEKTFPDHHVFSERDARDLLALAGAHGSLLVTTEKDLVRLAGAGGARAKLRERSRALPIRLVFSDRDGETIAGLVDGALRTGGYRQRAR